MRLRGDNLDSKNCHPVSSCVNYVIVFTTIVTFIGSLAESSAAFNSAGKSISQTETLKTIIRTSTSISIVGAKSTNQNDATGSRPSFRDESKYQPKNRTENSHNLRNTSENQNKKDNVSKNDNKNTGYKSTPTNKKTIIIISIVVVGLVIVAILIAVVIYCRCKSKSSTKKTVLVQTIKKVTVQWQFSTYGNFSEPVKIPIVKIEEQACNSKRDPTVDYEIPTDNDCEFPRDNLEFVKTIGEGSFAEVKLAKALKTSLVAVKMLKTFHNNDNLIDIVQEMEIMKMIGKHKNLLEFVGCCTQNGPLYVITAYAPHGNLLDFLRKHGSENNKRELNPSIHATLKVSLTQKDLISFGHQIAQGMEYIESKRFIHRDLAACNILVSDHYVMKIADLGLVRDFGWNDYHRKTKNGRLPVKWMAPEALLYRKYSIHSDVWSFGILLWEIMTFGGTPYPSITKIEQLHPLLQSGYRMEKPANCSSKVHQIMMRCWASEAESRPSFSQLVAQLDKLSTKSKNTKHKSTSVENLTAHNPLYACVDLSKSTYSLSVEESY